MTKLPFPTKVQTVLEMAININSYIELGLSVDEIITNVKKACVDHKEDKSAGEIAERLVDEAYELVLSLRKRIAN